MSILNFTEGICSSIPETRIMPVESFIKILVCFSYILKFTFIASDKINHVGGVVINTDWTSRNNTFIESISSST